MDNKLSVETGDAIVSLDKLLNRIKESGRKLDALQEKTHRSLTPLAKRAESAASGFKQLHDNVKGVSDAAERQRATLLSASNAVDDFYKNVSYSYSQARTLAKGYSGQIVELNRVLQETDSLNSYVNHQKRLNLVLQDTRQQLQRTEAAVVLLDTKEGKALETEKAKLSGKRQRTVLEEKQNETLRTQAAVIAQLDKEESKSVARNAEIIRSKRKILAMEAQQSSRIRELIASEQLRNTEDAKTIRSLELSAQRTKLREQAAKDAALAVDRQAIAEAKLNAELKFQQSDAGKTQAALRAQIAAVRKENEQASVTQVKKNRSVRLGNQLTASLRAGLQGAQTSIGMYTSSTIAAALATYSLSRAVRTTITVGMEFTEAMARTNAIMNSSSGMFSSVESQVRTLGETTQFTATQVAEAVTELGQAGLSAGESIIALAPALDLAAVGGISMAKSADHATNIMSAFGKQAEDLGGIVDVLATATTNSNTTIDQLANALTYAGPAANSAGYALNDTVAAIETLANSGIKSSKAGTALRRLFVSLVNPTKKGAEVLDRYGISVQNLDGSFRGLTDVMSQFDAAFQGKENERLAAIQDLVGVYATSPIAALMESNDSFLALKAQLDDAGGAAQEMKKKINDSLTFDTKEVKSAFQELQLKVFKDNEMQFRVWAQELTAFLQFLGSSTADGTTQLQAFATELQRTAKVALLMFGAFKTASYIQDTIAGTTMLAKGYKGVTEAVTAASAAMVRSERATAASTTANLANAASARMSAAAAGTIAVRALGVVSGVGAVAAMGMTLYSVYQMVFGDKSEALAGMEDQEKLLESQTRELSEQAKAAEVLRKKYDELTEASLKRKDASTFVNLTLQQRELQTELSASIKRINTFRALLERDDTSPQMKKAYEGRLLLAEREFQSQIRTSRVLYKQSRDLEDSYTAQQQLKRAELLVWEKIQAETDPTKMRMWEDALVNINAEMDKFNKGMREAANSAENMAAISMQYLSDNIAAAGAKLAASQETDTQKFQRIVTNMQARQEAHVSLMQVVAKDGVSAFASADDMNDQITKSTIALSESQASYLGFYPVYEKIRDSYKESADALATDLLPKEQLRAKYIQEQAAAAAVLASVEKDIADGVPAPDYAAADEAAKKLLDLRGKLARLDKDSSTSVRKSNRETRESISTFEQLQRQFDSTAYAEGQLVKTQESLTKLVQQGTISQEDYNKAISQASDNFRDLVVAESEHLKVMKQINDAYSSSPIQKQIDDLNLLAEARRKGNISEQEYLRGRSQIEKSMEDRTKVPTLSGSGIGGPIEGVTDAVSDRVHGLHDLRTDRADLVSGAAGAISEVDRRANELLRLEEDELKRVEIKAKAAEEIKNIEDLTTQNMVANMTQQQEFAKNSALMIGASMLDMASNIFGMMAAVGEDATSAQKAAFIAQKALAISSILVQTHVAAATTRAALAPAGEGMAALIMAQGYASAGLVAGMAVNEYAGAYDKGGYIPAGKYGLVGEIGPEIVHGPANVTSRKDTAAMLKDGRGSGPQNVTIAPEINIEYSSEGASNSEQDGRVLGNMVKAVVLDTMRNELRPNGMLHRR